MKGTKFVIIADQASRLTRNKLSLALRALGETAWWHQFQHAWLIIDPKNRDATWWRDWCTGVAPELRIVVMAVELSGWAGRLPKDSAKWLHNNWKSGVE
jgi:hypothetical protein